MRPAAVVLGVPLDALTMSEALDRIGELVASGRRTGRIHQVSTVNVDFLVNALEDQSVLALLQDNSLNLADGAPVVWASRWLGTPVPERVAGADLVPALAAASAERGWRIHLFGGAEGVADRACRVLLDRHPGAVITAEAGPHVGADGSIDDGVVASIASREIDVLCVALGNPKQERFIGAHGSELGCPVQIGVGGSLDMLLGVRRRAPRWMQRIGIEWIFRAAQEPGRLGRRYAHDLRIFLPRIVRYVYALAPSRKGIQLGVSVIGRRAVVAEMDSGDAARTWSELRVSGLETVDIDIGGDRPLEPVSHGRLIQLIRRARRSGVSVRLSSIAPPVESTLSTAGTWALLQRAAEVDDTRHTS